MPTSIVNLDVTQYVRVNQRFNSLMLQAHRDSVRIVVSDLKPARSNTAFHIIGGSSNEPYSIPSTDSNVWALAMSEHSSLVVTEMIDHAPVDWYAYVSMGKLPGYEVVPVQGENLDVDIAGYEHLWCAEELMVYPVTGEQWEVTSTSANDDASGVGANVIQIEYLDVNYNPQKEIVVLSGLTPSLTVATDCFRLLNIQVVLTGSTGYNNGIIHVKQLGGGFARGCVSVGYNRASHGFYTVPLGKTAFFMYGNAAMGKGKDAKIDLYFSYGDTNVFTKNSFTDLYQNSVTFNPTMPVGPFVEKSELQFRCTTLDTNADASAFMQLMLVDNEVL